MNMGNQKSKTTLYYLGSGLGIILVVAFLTSQIIMPLFFGRSRNVEVPDLTKMNLAKASSVLLNKKIHAVVKDSIWSDEIKSGHVISQKPVAGEKVKPDGTVYLVVSKGSKFVKVPYIIGMNIQTAWITLKNRNLSFSIADSVISTLYPPDTVVSSRPAAGENAEKNSKIQLVVSKRSYSTPPDTADVLKDFEF